MRTLSWFCLAIPAVVAAQQPGRKVEGEVSGNLFFGNTRQVLASTRAEFERADSGSAFRAIGRFNYGETTTDAAGTVVSKRSWNVGSSYDLRPYADFTPFVRVGTESSFENRIDRRSGAGAGARYNIARTTGTDAILSAGVAGERTSAIPPGDSLGVETLARAITSLRLRRDLTSRVTVTNETTYQPALTSGNDYTILSISALKMRLARFAALTLTFRDNYDSRAVLRGARVNNDGELLVGLLTTF
ncbi:MAG: DUF481 domain-containing protein [Gemmatimonadaceae bacterium]